MHEEEFEGASESAEEEEVGASNVHPVQWSVDVLLGSIWRYLEMMLLIACVLLPEWMGVRLLYLHLYYLSWMVYGPN